MSRTQTAVSTLVLVFAASLASAQTFEGGVKGGVSFAGYPTLQDMLKEEGATDVSSRLGFTGGGFFTVRLTNVFAIQSELLYAQKGIKGTDPFSFAEGDFAFNLDYIDIPVLARFGASSGRGLQALAGPSFNFNIRAKAVDEGFQDGDVDIKDDIETAEIGFVLGAGFYSTNLFVEGRYVEGLTNVMKHSGDESYRSRSFLVLTGIRFR